MSLQTLLWLRRPTELLEWCGRRYGKAFTVLLPGYEVMLTSDREAIRTMFAARPDEMSAGRFNRALRPVVGASSVLLLDGSEHMHRRKLLLPSFHGDRMRFYGATMAEITRRAIARWPEGDAFTLQRDTKEITLQIILRTVFGVEDGAELAILRQQITHAMEKAESAISLLPLLYLAERPEAEQRFPWSWWLAARDRANATLYRLIAARRAEPRSARRKDVLAMLLEARDEDGEGFTDKELRDELITTVAAGYETSATSLAWAVERILSHPAIYRQLREEVRGLGKDPNPEQLAALPYLDATIKEVLRLRPVLPLVGRYLNKPYTLAGCDLPAGTLVSACIYLAHRDPDVYPEPETFRPERFVGIQPDPASWLPFGGGVRRCIGFQFAMYEMKIVLGTMLASCELELAQQTPARIVRRTAITFSPEGGTRVRARAFAA